MTRRNGFGASTVRAFGVVVLLEVMIVGDVAYAQEFRWPEEPENLQVLGDEFKGAKLGEVMRGFATSLGVRCEHCHVGDGMDLTTFDFAADDKPAKHKARLMLEMVAAMNDDYLSRLSEIETRDEPQLQVECITCHRGQPRPVMLGDLLEQKVHTEGIEAAIAEYRALRERYYGGFSYDFSSGVLTGLGERLSKAGDHETGIRFVKLEIEFNGETPSAYYTLGGIEASASRVDDAIDSYTKGLALAPENWKPFFRAQLDKLTGESGRE